jgi:hypothetical protein
MHWRPGSGPAATGIGIPFSDTKPWHEALKDERA